METMDITRTDNDIGGGAGRLCSALGVLVLLGLGVGCETEPPPMEELEREVEYHIQSAKQTQTHRKQILGDIENARQRIWAAVTPDVMDAEIADALIDAADRGLQVRVVADADASNSEGFPKLQDSGAVATSFGDGDLNYLPNPTLSQILTYCDLKEDRQVTICESGSVPQSPCLDGSGGGTQGSMCRPGSFNLMSHRFFIIDETTVWNLAGGFGGPAGNLGWKATSELIREDFEREFKQMFRGVFATELDKLNGPVKSSGDGNVDYYNDEGMFKLRFNPQERLMKHVVDEVYGARSSIEITTATLTNPFVLKALEYKANNGFKVRVVVGEDSQPPADAVEATRRLKQLGAKTHPAGDQLPSTLVIDDEPKNPQGKRWPRTALALSHPMWHAQPFTVVGPEPNDMSRDDRVIVYRSDQFVDGNFWKLEETAADTEANTGRWPEIDQMAQYFDHVWDNSGNKL